MVRQSLNVLVQSVTQRPQAVGTEKYCQSDFANQLDKEVSLMRLHFISLYTFFSSQRCISVLYLHLPELVRLV